MLVLLHEQDPRNENEFWLGADLVIEIVIPDKPTRDAEEKPRDYAEAQMSEHWRFNPLDATLTAPHLKVLVLLIYLAVRSGRAPNQTAARPPTNTVVPARCSPFGRPG